MCCCMASTRSCCACRSWRLAAWGLAASVSSAIVGQLGAEGSVPAMLPPAESAAKGDAGGSSCSCCWDSRYAARAAAALPCPREYGYEDSLPAAGSRALCPLLASRSPINAMTLSAAVLWAAAESLMGNLLGAGSDQKPPLPGSAMDASDAVSGNILSVVVEYEAWLLSTVAYSGLSADSTMDLARLAAASFAAASSTPLGLEIVLSGHPAGYCWMAANDVLEDDLSWLEELPALRSCSDDGSVCRAAAGQPLPLLCMESATWLPHISARMMI